MRKIHVCGRCENIVSLKKEDISEGYFAYCENHDEDLYAFECEEYSLNDYLLKSFDILKNSFNEVDQMFSKPTSYEPILLSKEHPFVLNSKIINTNQHTFFYGNSDDVYNEAKAFIDDPNLLIPSVNDSLVITGVEYSSEENHDLNQEPEEYYFSIQPMGLNLWELVDRPDSDYDGYEYNPDYNDPFWFYDFSNINRIMWLYDTFSKIWGYECEKYFHNESSPFKDKEDKEDKEDVEDYFWLFYKWALIPFTTAKFSNTCLKKDFRLPSDLNESRLSLFLKESEFSEESLKSFCEEAGFFCDAAEWLKGDVDIDNVKDVFLDILKGGFIAAVPKWSGYMKQLSEFYIKMLKDVEYLFLK